jgi:hypothetical protein
MLARAEDLDRGNAGLMDPFQPDRSEPMIHEQMGRKNVLHPVQ